MARWGLTRADVVVAVGGGVVTDVAGFAAAVYHRGIAGRPRARPRCSARSTPPSAARPASTCPRARTWSAPSGSRPPCSATPRPWPPCRPGSTAAGWARWPSTPSSGVDGLRDLSLDDAVAACVACKAEVVGADEREVGPPGPAQLRAHPGPRPGDGRPLRPAPRRGGGHRPGLRRPPGPPAGPHRRRPGGRARAAGGRLRPARPACPPASTTTSWSRSWAGTRRPPTAGLTFVLDGPRGLEVVAGVPDGRRSSRRPRRSCAGREPAAPLVLLLSGPNLNLLGDREPDVYGTATLADHVARPPTRRPRPRPRASSTSSPTTKATWSTPSTGPGAGPRPSSSTPGAFTHYAWSLHDALAAFDGPVVELHLSNPDAREAWRHTSVVSPVATGSHRRVRRARLPPGHRAVAGLLGVEARLTASTGRLPTTPSPWMSRGRLDRLAGGAGRRPAATALLVTSLTNIRYLTGFTGSAGLLFVLPDEAVLRHRRPLRHPGRRAAGRQRASRPRVEVAAGRRAGDGPRGSSSAARLDRARPGGGPRQLGPPAGLRRRLVPRRRAGARPSAWSKACGGSRTPGELARIAAAARIADEALAAVRPHAGRRPDRGRVRPGPRLRDAPARGAAGPSFETIVAGGPNAAKPHHRPSDRADRAGRAGGDRLRGPRRRLLLGHDPDGVGGRAVDRRAAPGGRRGRGQPGRRGGRGGRRGRRAPSVDQACRAGHRRRRAGPSGSCTAPATGSGSTSTRPRRWPPPRPIHCRSAMSSPSSRGCTFPGSAGSGSRTPWW